MFWGLLQARAMLRSLCLLLEDGWSCLVDGAFSSHRLGPVPAWGSCWGALMATAQEGGTEGHQSLVSYWDALPCGLSSSSFWYLPCSEYSTLWRGAGKSPSASPGQSPEPFLMFLRVLPAPPSPDGGYTQPQQQWQRQNQNPQRPELTPGHPGGKPRERAFSCS